MREVKKPEERMADILRASEKLFSQKGYLKTTTDDIIKALGISRGLLYYHFKSKEEILWHIAENKTKPLLGNIRSIVNDSTMSAPQKILAFLKAAVTSDPETSGLSEEEIKEMMVLQEAIQLREHDYMLDRINHKIAYETTFFLEQIILQGIKEGHFHVKHPHATAAYLMTGFTFVMNDPHYHGNGIEEQMELFKGFKELLNLSLGVKTALF